MFNLFRSDESSQSRLGKGVPVRSTSACRSADLLAMSVQGMRTSLRPPDDGEVHVWSVLVSEMRPALSSVARFLSRQEQEAAARFVRPVDSERYVVTHGLLRVLLGRYQSIDPERCKFATGGFGKPELVADEGLPPLRFNLAHSGDVVLYAVTQSRKVGVDVEKIRMDLDVMELAQSQFADEEMSVLQALDPGERQEAFFRAWTRKEAYVKARGEGLGFALNKFAVTFGRDEAVRVRWAEDDPDASTNWTMLPVDSYPGYAAAVVVEGQALQLVSRRWDVLL